MQTFACSCGNMLFFENDVCLACGKQAGWCPVCRRIAPLEPLPEGGFVCGLADCGVALALCANYAAHNVCNRCVPAEQAAEQPLCDCCRFNETIPDLAAPGNLEKWARLEAAKRRLFYGLDMVQLPRGTAADGFNPPLSFDFKADVLPTKRLWRIINPGERVMTGHANGKITINIREADDVEREKLRVDLDEAQRTLIGHFRHEIAHYYWELLVKDRCEPDFIAVFGDHNNPTYADALERHYNEGPPADWQQRFISSYASMHPWEDFAETWAAYLDMASVLHTASHVGFVDAPRGETVPPTAPDLVASQVQRYQELGMAVNEINRSLGLTDLVPEVFAPPVIDKMRWIAQLIDSNRIAPAPSVAAGA